MLVKGAICGNGGFCKCDGGDEVRDPCLDDILLNITGLALFMSFIK